jgi:hypothetical protein
MLEVEPTRVEAKPDLEFQPRVAFFVVYALGILFLGVVGGLIAYGVLFSGHPNARPQGVAQWFTFAFLVGTLLTTSVWGLVVLVLRYPYRIRVYRDFLEVRRSWRDIQRVAFADVATVQVSQISPPLETVCTFCRLEERRRRDQSAAGAAVVEQCAS